MGCKSYNWLQLIKHYSNDSRGNEVNYWEQQEHNNDWETQMSRTSPVMNSHFVIHFGYFSHKSHWSSIFGLSFNETPAKKSTWIQLASAKKDNSLSVKFIAFNIQPDFLAGVALKASRNVQDMTGPEWQKFAFNLKIEGKLGCWNYIPRPGIPTIKREEIWILQHEHL